MRRWTAAVILPVLLLAGALPAAGDWVGERLCPTGLPQAGEFGSSVVVGDGGTIAVGDYRHDVVVLFGRNAANGCEQTAVIRGRAGEWFGFDLAIDGDWLLIGAPQSGGTGAGYLYDLKTESLKALAVPQAQRGDEVGSAVAMHGGFLAIGARGADDRRGRVYAGRAGALTAVPAPPGLAQRAELGQSVALSGTTLVMGAPSPFRGSGSPGAAWIFDVQSEEFLFLAPPGGLEPEAAFGYAVAVDRGRILVGAPLADRNGVDAGAVFSFEGGQGRELGFPSRSGDQLGVAVALEEGIAVAGARYAGGTRGAAYLMEKSGPSQSLEQAVPGGAQFGFSVAIHGGIVVVGAFRENGAGAAYRFDVPMAVEFAAASSSVSESAGTAPLQVIVRGPVDRLSAPVTVDLKILGGTAGRDDFRFSEGPYVIPAGTPTGVPYELARAEILPDALQETPETFRVELSAKPPAVTGAPGVHEVTIHDSLLLVPAGPLRTSEAGGSIPLVIRLAVQPTANVVVALSAGEDAGDDPPEGSVSPARLTFTSKNWERGQTVQVTGRDDAFCDGDRAYEIRVTTTSRDPRYAGLSLSIPAENVDDELACLSAAQTVCTDAGGTVVYTIVLANSVSGVPDAPARLDDILPLGVSVVTASADRGTATTDTVANSVRWTGPVPAAGDETTITIVAALDGPPGPELDNEAEVTYDRDGRGHVESFLVVFGDVIPCPP